VVSRVNTGHFGSLNDPRDEKFAFIGLKKAAVVLLVEHVDASVKLANLVERRRLGVERTHKGLEECAGRVQIRIGVGQPSFCAAFPMAADLWNKTLPSSCDITHDRQLNTARPRRARKARMPQHMQ